MTRAAPRVVIDVGRLLDPATERVDEGRRIVVENGRIEAVLPADAPVDPSAQWLDLTELTVLPGLIDCHTHLVGDLEYAGMPAVGDTADDELEKGYRNAAATLRAGFTTVRDVGTFRAFLDVSLRDAIEAGRAEGPRMQCAAGYVTAPGGGGEVSGQPGANIPPEMRRGVVTSPAEAREVVRRFVDGGADLIKVVVTGAVLTEGTEPGAIELDAETVAAAVGEASRLGRFVAAHAHGADGIVLAARAGARSIEHGSLIDERGIAAMLERDTWLVADIYDGDWITEEGRRAGWSAAVLRKNDETTEAQREGFRRALLAGVRVAYGTDSGVYPHGRNARQFAYMVRYGMTPWGAIRSATVDAARCMGWDGDVGSLERGRFADLVALHRDPLADVAALEDPLVVVKGGRIVEDRRQRRPVMDL